MQFSKILQSLQNLGIRKILGVFKIALILPMKVEAALPPPKVRLNSATRAYAFRLLKIFSNYPINIATNLILNPQKPPRREITKGTLQLINIYNSIKDLYCKKDLESIQHYYFAPWQRETHYTI